MAEELKPCPFCAHGGPFVLADRGSYCGKCRECGARGPWSEFEDEAATEWNARTLASSPTAADLDKDAETDLVTALCDTHNDRAEQDDEIARLREALAPLAALADHANGCDGNHQMYISVAACRRARTALKD